MPTSNRSHFLVDPSHAPLLASIALFCASESLIILLNSVSTLLMLVPLVLNMWFLSAEIGFIDNASIVSESTRSRYMVSFYWLVAAEAFAFFSLLFSWFTNSIWAPAVSISSIIESAEMPSAIGLSLINSALLLSSSVTITYSHISLGFSSLQITVNSLVVTIVLSVVFLSVQWVEFSISSLTIASSFYSSILFSSLSFHSMHVLVSVLFLSYALGRVLNSNSTPESHPVYLCSVIYWHFVDVVWVFVYFSYYLAL